MAVAMAVTGEQTRSPDPANVQKNRRVAAQSCFALLVFGTVAFLAGQASGQAAGAFQSDKLDPSISSKVAMTAMEQARKEGIRKRDLSTSWEKYPAFEAYYKRLLTGKLKDAEYVGELGTVTQTFLDDLDSAMKSGSPAADLVRRTIIENALAIAPNNYHPAARVNATLMLALADDAQENNTTKTPPVPSTAAFVPLVKIYQKADFPDGVRAAALQGIARHVSLGAVKNPQFRAGIASMMQQLAKSDPPAGRSPEAHAFLQRYAIDILAILASPSTSPDTVKTLVALSTDKEKPNLIAAYAASKMAKIEPGKQKVDEVPKLLQAWADRAADTIDNELLRIINLDPPVPVRDQPVMPTDQTLPQGRGGSGGAYGSGEAYGMAEAYGSGPGGSGGYERGMDPSGGYGESYGRGMAAEYGAYGPTVVTVKPQPLEVITSRRRINHILQQLQLGVTGTATPGVPTKTAGILGSVPADEKEVIDKWIATVNEVVTAINADTLDDRVKFVEALTAQAVILRELAGVKAEGLPGELPLIGEMPAVGGMPAGGAGAVAPLKAMPGSAPPASAPPASAASAPVSPIAPAAMPVDELQ